MKTEIDLKAKCSVCLNMIDADEAILKREIETASFTIPIKEGESDICIMANIWFVRKKGPNTYGGVFVCDKCLEGYKNKIQYILESHITRASESCATCPDNMDIAESGPKYAKADCCDYGKEVACVHRVEYDTSKISMCAHSCFSPLRQNDIEAFEAINKPCHGGYQPKE